MSKGFQDQRKTSLRLKNSKETLKGKYRDTTNLYTHLKHDILSINSVFASLKLIEKSKQLFKKSMLCILILRERFWLIINQPDVSQLHGNLLRVFLPFIAQAAQSFIFLMVCRKNQSSYGTPQLTKLITTYKITEQTIGEKRCLQI